MFGFKRKKNTINAPVAYLEEKDANQLVVNGNKLKYAHAYSKGNYKGKGSKPTAEQVAQQKSQAQYLFQKEGYTVIQIAKEMQLSRPQIYTYLGNLVEKRPRNAK